MSNINLGVVLVVILGVFLINIGIFYEKIKELTKSGFFKYFKVFVIIILCIEFILVSFIAVFGIVDTNSNPNNIDFVIPANDDATKSIEVILGAVCAAIQEGLEERKVEKADEEAAAAQAASEAPAPKERRQRVRKAAPKAEAEKVAEVAAE